MTMPRDKDLKRLVRTRMKKTGEAYTTARAQILRKPKKRAATAGTMARGKSSAPDYGELSGFSDELIKEKTGCTWTRWVSTLDALGATELPHREIAQMVSEKFKVQPWWTQAVTTGYERIKGLRAIGQRRDGSYEANKSRTYNVPVKVLFDAWSNAHTRRAWLPEDVKVRTATSPKSMRIGWSDGSIIAVGFMSKGAGKSAVALGHTRLRDKKTADNLKQYWSERLDALGAVLKQG
jgi:hypothetical protein